MISSAVIVPESEALSASSSSYSHKRRQSSSSLNDQLKRPCLQDSSARVSNEDVLSPTASSSSPPRRKAGVTGTRAIEERRRGQRLFGALLGTLSQSSTSTAQSRRADIEKKQLGKLQQQDEEVEVERRRKRERLDVIRRKEQVVWDEESMRLRHRNLVAEAHFLKTKTEPRLCYKPWELRIPEEEQIKSQIEDVESCIQIELSTHQTQIRCGSEVKITGEVQSLGRPDNNVNAAHTDDHLEGGTCEGAENQERGSVSAGAIPGGERAMETDTAESEGTMQATKSQAITTSPEEQSTRRDEKPNEDQGGDELVEGQEDDVIY